MEVFEKSNDYFCVGIYIYMKKRIIVLLCNYALVGMQNSFCCCFVKNDCDVMKKMSKAHGLFIENLLRKKLSKT